jgi:ABC-type uncharacterized transport system ATPase subunit
MSDDGVDVDRMIRRAIGGDEVAVSWITGQATTSADPTVMTMAALLERQPEHVDRALAISVTSRDRQVAAIAGAHLRGEHELVDVLARDHLVDHPDSFLVAWIAADAPGRGAGGGRR